MAGLVRSTKGFTLVEVLIAAVVMGVVLIGFLKLQSSSIMLRAHSRFMTTAIEVASDFIDQVTVSGRAMGSIVVDGVNIADSGNDNKTIGNTVFARRWTIVRDAPAPDLMTLTVTVSVTTGLQSAVAGLNPKQHQVQLVSILHN